MAQNIDEKRLQSLRDQNKLLEEAKTLQLSLNNIQSAQVHQDQITKNNLEIANELKAKGKTITETEKKELDKINKTQGEINTKISLEQKLRQAALAITKETGNQLLKSWGYLMQSDKIIKSTVLNLGMSGVKADMMRASFEQSAGQIARMGGSLEDVQSIMQGYAEETGRARALSSQMVTDVAAIGKGTGLGIENATRLAGQFELMGVNARGTLDYVQGVVDTSERMGVNTTKVLKNVGDNFKKLSTFNFQQGVKGYAQMAQYSEKMKIDMGQALNAAETANSLEKAIDLAANLQVMGGEFAKTDPFEMLFLSRNDPAKFTEKINEMTKGVVTFRKMSDGSFEKFISPADRDRLGAVEKSLGMQTGELTNQALRMADIQKMRQKMQGLGLSDEQKTLIEGAATLDTKTGKFQVQIGNTMRDISTLTSAQADAFKSESVSLKDRALEAQTFEDAFKATINELKSALLPILRAVNGVLTVIRPIVVGFTEWATKGSLAWIKVIGTFTAAALLWKGANNIFAKGVGKLSSFVGGGNKTSLDPLMSNGKQMGITQQKAYDVGQVNRSKAGAGLAKAQGMKNLSTGGGVGAAAVGIGAGIGLAAVGISKLADSMAKLDKTQVAVLPEVIKSLGLAFMFATAPIAIMAATATMSAPGLLALGAVALGVGAAIGIAAVGIGEMAKGLAVLIDSGSKAGDSMGTLALGMAGVAGSLMLFTAGSLGLVTFGATMGMIAMSAPAITRVGDAFTKINAVMSGSKDDFIAVADAVNSISLANTKGGGMFAEIANLLKTPLKVEFANKDVAIVSNITLEIDGEKFMSKVYKPNKAANLMIDAQKGK